MKKDKLEKPILIINRQTGLPDHIVETKRQYELAYKYFINMNDVKMAIKVFSEMSGQTKTELLKDFNLIELVNCFSTRYMAKAHGRGKNNGN